VKKIEFPESLKLYQNIESWPSDFEAEEVFMDEFIASQLAQRLQADYAQDKKVTDAFEKVKADFLHFPPGRAKIKAPLPVAESGKPFFEAVLSFTPREQPNAKPDILNDKNLQYLVQMLLDEFVTVVHGYDFKDYEVLKLELKSNEAVAFSLSPEQLEKFRKKKLSLLDLIRSAEPLPTTPAEPVMSAPAA
jgi:hypothetical protein